MVILMADEGSTTCEGLLTIRIWTLVRSFSRVDSTVPCQGAGIAEWLCIQRQFIPLTCVCSVEQRLPCRNVRTCGVSRRYGRERVQSTRTSE